MLRAAWMAQELLTTFEKELGEVAILPGDGTRDNKVNQSDLDLVLLNWGDPGDWSDGDTSGNGTVEQNDLDDVSLYWQEDLTEWPGGEFLMGGGSMSEEARRADFLAALDESLARLGMEDVWEALDVDMSPQAAAYAERRNMVVAGLRDAGYEVADTGGAFYVFPRVPAGKGTAQEFVANAIKNELLIIQFPSTWLSDGGRAINNSESDWPRSLTGFAKRAYDYYVENLQPLGYKARAQIVNFPGGKPGDVGLFLSPGRTVLGP